MNNPYEGLSVRALELVKWSVEKDRDQYASSLKKKNLSKKDKASFKKQALLAEDKLVCIATALIVAKFKESYGNPN